MQQTHAGIAIPRADWLALHREEIIDPDLPIVDAHHHLWVLPTSTYLHPELTEDIQNGHNIRSTVFVDCHSHYRTDGVEEFRPVGETAFVIEQVNAITQILGNTQCCAAIVGWVDLSLGDRLSSVLQAHIEAGNGRFRGVRARPTWHADPAVHPAGVGREGILRDALVQQGARRLGAMGLSLDLWVYHTQLSDVFSLATNCPDTLIVLNHCGGPLGIGPYASQRTEVFVDWIGQIRALARLPNVRMKLGGLAMPRMGFRLDQFERPADSAVLASLWRPYFEACIDSFGADRCMFESNFPVDKTACSYAVLWNAFKRVSEACSTAERSKLFSDTAALTYSIDL